VDEVKKFFRDVREMVRRKNLAEPALSEEDAIDPPLRLEEQEVNVLNLDWAPPEELEDCERAKQIFERGLFPFSSSSISFFASLILFLSSVAHFPPALIQRDSSEGEILPLSNQE